MPATGHEPIDLFESAVKKELGYNWRIARNIGASNSFLARTDKNRLYFGGPNLNFFLKQNNEGLVIVSVARFATGIDVYYALFFQDDIEIIKERLKLMLEMGNQEHPDYTFNNKNVRIIFSQIDKRFYCLNKENWVDMDLSNPHVQPSFQADGLLYAVYPPGKGSFQSIAAGEFIRLLQKTLGPEKVKEIAVWKEEGTIITSAMQVNPATISVAVIESYISKMGLYYSGDLVKRFHAALNFHPQKHFVILTGLSGTGKTSLIRAYCRAVHGIKSLNDEDPLFFMCPVRPEWTDPTGLSGYYDIIADNYIVPPFLEAMMTALAHPNTSVFVCLDEMNLARVEYYLSDIISAIESQEKINLHSSELPLDGSTGVSIPSNVKIPDNLYIIGTINIDETTNPLSDKVLDRAVVIDTSEMSLENYFSKLKKDNSPLVPAIEQCGEVINYLFKSLLPHGMQFGYRVVREFLQYFSFAVEKIGNPPHETIDELIAQKILVKLRGDSRQRQLLGDLETYFEANEYAHSKMIITEMLKELDYMGAFQYAR